MSAPLPPSWNEFHTETGQQDSEEIATGTTRWDNPLDAKCREWYRNKVQICETEASMLNLEKSIEEASAQLPK
ncbi:hypothetical protein KFE25_012376 [Diacronema lutheri]|uniref:WW domain-containing protein n=1 Tax=Diacronema lutheri TaxID=2081491 RepID=A0A8J5XIE2_DIALT|nr:hypothetical protein KFE25_012376 [Diacronema lutheri]